MDFITAVETCFRKYVTFSGRASRSEFWWFMLFVVLVSIVLSVIDVVIFEPEESLSPLSDLFSLATFLPTLSVTSRRLHDIDRSAWWMLLFLLPVIGWAVLIYWHVLKGSEGDNQFGADPLDGYYDDDDDDGGDYAASSIPRVGD